MKKFRVIALLLLIVMIVSNFAYANEKGNPKPYIKLSFSGTTIQCSGKVTSIGDTINATMELKQGGVVIDSWNASGVGIASMNGTHAGVSGQTYTLVIYGTVNGVSFASISDTKVCP